MPVLDRILQTDTATIAAPTGFTPTSVTISRWDGTVLVAAAATAGTYALTSTHTALLDTLTAAWTDGTRVVKTRHEIVGGFHFDLAELAGLETGTRNPDRSSQTMSDLYTDTQLREARTYAEQGIEDECGRAFVPRYRLVKTQAPRWGSLVLGIPDVRLIRSVSSSGVAWTPEQVSALDGDMPYARGGWWGTLTIGVEYGRDDVPDIVRSAALALAKSWRIRGPVDDRAISGSDANGNPIQFTVPGMGLGGRFGLTEVTQAIDAWRAPVVA